jgi:phospholipid/cholesterol/gamma-HCH transport system substrate-binding protein
METRASYIIVGCFVLSFIVGIVGSVIWLAGIDSSQQVTTYHILFDGSVTGLRNGNPVRYRGVPVGLVTDIRISPENVEQVLVAIEVPEETPIKEDAEATLEYQGITGIGFIQIIGGTQGADKLSPDIGQRFAIIPSKPSQIQEVIEQAPELINRFIGLVDRASEILNGENQQNLAGTLANINRFSTALADGGGDMNRLLVEANDTLASLRRTSQEAEKLVGAFASRRENLARLVETTLEDVGQLAHDAKPMIGTADETLRDVRKIIGQMGPMFETADGAMRDVAGAMEDVGGLAKELRPHVVPMVEQTHVTMENLGDVAADLRLAAERIGMAAKEAGLLVAENRDSVSHFSNTGLYEFTHLLSELRIMVSSFTRISTELERDPARFLFGDSQQGYEAK